VKKRIIPRRSRPDESSPGTIAIVEAGEEKPVTVEIGQTVVLGRDPASTIVVANDSVSLSHAMVGRAGPGWLVTSLDPSNLAYLLDPTGRAQPIEAELGLRSGVLLLGTCEVRLHAPGL
jgi:hypothetical protein